MTIEEDINQLEKSLKEETDIAIGIKELFKDSFKDEQDLSQHDVDIRTRLCQSEIRAMSVTNFLGTINIRGLKKSSELMTKTNTKKLMITKSLSVLMFQLKRHLIAKDGKSRNEITDILKGSLERKQEGKGFFKNLFTPNT